MYESRIQFAMDNFIEAAYFLPMNNKYELKENKDSGKSRLIVYVVGENICVNAYDEKKRCNFLRTAGTLGMQKCIDHFVLRQNGSSWDLHMIEMKSSVGNKTWLDIKAKMRSSYLNVKALCEFLGITLNCVYAYTTYEKERFEIPEHTADPKTLVPLFGEKATNFKRDEWDCDVIKVKIDRMIEFHHTAIKMENDTDFGLCGVLHIK